MITQSVAKELVNTTYENLPREAIEATKKSILDILGVMFPPTTLVKNCASIYELISEAGLTAAGEAKPIDDIRSSADYRRKMVAILVEKAIRQLVAQAQAG